MPFERIPTIPTSEELLDKAFRRALRAKGGKKGYKAEKSMILTASNILSDNLRKISRKFPNLDQIPPFYAELIDILVGIDSIKISLSHIEWAGKKIFTLSRGYLRRLNEENPTKLRKEAFGRFASILKKIDEDLKLMNEARNRLRNLPSVDDSPTIVVAGYANVGKSSFVEKVSSAKPEIDHYPFTTKGIYVGHILRGKKRYQIIDTPGLLDRPLTERNEIELQAISALRHLADVILFIIDPSETCGYEIERQLNLLEEIRREFRVPILVVSNKCDLEGKEVSVEMRMSTLTGENVEKVLEALLRTIENK
ncbi:MAG: NOG1 family protein [Candidatus Syntropharchaeia archaeon]